MAAVDIELVSFLRAMLDADEHNVVTVQALAPPGVDVLLDSTVPALDGVRAVVEAYAATGDVKVSSGAAADPAFESGRAARLGEAVRLLASIYHDDRRFQARWISNPAS